MKKFLYTAFLSLFLLAACASPAENESQETPSVTDSTPTPTPTDQSQEDEPQKNDETSGITEGFDSNTAEWDEMRELVSAELNETLQSLNVPSSSSDPDLLYISTSGPYIGEFPEGMTKNTVYTYNKTDQSFDSLYTEEENRTLATLGLDGDKLIILETPIDYSPGPCFNLWADLSDILRVNHLYLSLSNPGELMPYSVPQDVLDKAEDEIEACQEEISNIDPAEDLGLVVDLEDACVESGGEFTSNTCTCPEGLTTDLNGQCNVTLDKDI